MRYFVLVFDRQSGQLLEELRSYGETDVEDAQRDRFEREIEFRDRPGVEAVILGAESEAELLRTHARYFQSLTELATNR